MLSGIHFNASGFNDVAYQRRLTEEIIRPTYRKKNPASSSYFKSLALFNFQVLQTMNHCNISVT